MKKMNLKDVPEEVFVECLLGYVPVKNLLKIETTSKLFYEYCNSSILWKGILFNCFFINDKIAAEDRLKFYSKLIPEISQNDGKYKIIYKFYFLFWKEIITAINPPKGFDDGLSRKEMSLIEKKYDFKFPIELKEFFYFFLPIGNDFYDWRDSINPKVKENKKEEVFCSIEERYERVISGFDFDLKHNQFGCPNFTFKGQTFEEKSKEMKKQLKEKAPKLIPVYIHRFILSGNDINLPILSIHQTDIIYYGYNFFDYIQREFQWEKRRESVGKITPKKPLPVPYYMKEY